MFSVRSLKIDINDSPGYLMHIGESCNSGLISLLVLTSHGDSYIVC